jgi:Kef-type K+ transport system membrane component KefB
LALSLAESLVSGSIKLVPILLITAKAVGFIAIGIFVVKTLLNKMLSGLDKSKLAEKYPESIFIFAMMVAFLYSITAELVGLSAIVGAFLAGASFDAVHLKRAAVFKEGAEHLQIIFASIFFISLGVLMDLRVITISMLVFVVVLTIVALLTKVIGCGGAAKILGWDIRNSLIIGVGMIPRGEVAMIVALIGLNQRLIPQSTYSALILMALLTTVIPPIILRNWLFKERREKKQALTPP